MPISATTAAIVTGSDSGTPNRSRQHAVHHKSGSQAHDHAGQRQAQPLR
jgi:hypothetical protein